MKNLKNLLYLSIGVFFGICISTLFVNFNNKKVEVQEEKKDVFISDTLNNQFDKDTVVETSMNDLHLSDYDTISINKKIYHIIWSDEFYLTKLDLLNWNLSKEKQHSFKQDVLRLDGMLRLTTKEKMLFDHGVIELRCKIKKRGSISLLSPSSKIVLLERNHTKVLVGQYNMETEEKDIKVFDNVYYQKTSDYFIIRLRFTEKYIEWYFNDQSIYKAPRLSQDSFYLSIATYDEHIKNAFEIDYIRYYVPSQFKH